MSLEQATIEPSTSPSTTTEEEEEVPATATATKEKKKSTKTLSKTPSKTAAVKKTIAKKVQGSVRHRGTQGNKRNQPYVNSSSLHDLLLGITDPAIKRLAKRGGIKRVSNQFCPEIRKLTNAFLSMLLQKSATYMESRRHKTMMAYDVIHALRLMGRPVYGVVKNTK